MRALSVIPKHANSADITEVQEPALSEGALLVEMRGVGVCGTDLEIVRGEYGWAPPNQERLILGHESIGKVLEAPQSSGFAAGDWVVGIVREPDPEPCRSCAVGEWDMCRNGRYTEHGIKELNGFLAERYRLVPEFAVKVEPSLAELGVLLEPASVVAKAWEHIESIGRRALFEPRTVLVTGAGSIGLLAALLAVQRGFDVHVLDRSNEGPKPALVRDLGATFHIGDVRQGPPPPDIVLECTGVGSVVLDAFQVVAPGGIVCLTGISSGGRTFPVDASALNRELVLENNVVFGSVNANRRHYELAAAALAKADKRWLERLITRRLPLDQWRDALTRQPDDVKTIITPP